jgi:hypothetical protein
MARLPIAGGGWAGPEKIARLGLRKCLFCRYLRYPQDFRGDDRACIECRPPRA